MPIQYGNKLTADGNPLLAMVGGIDPAMAHYQPLADLGGYGICFGGSQLMQKGQWLQTLNGGTIAPVASANPPENIATTAAGPALTQMQLSYDGGTTVWLPFKLAANQVIGFGGFFKLSEVTTKGFVFGLAESNNAMITGTYNLTDLVGFYSATGGTGLLGVVRTASTSTESASLATLVAGTYVQLQVKINGLGSVEFYVNGSKVLTQTTMTNKPTAALTLGIGYYGAAKTCTWKNLYAYQGGW